MLNKQFPDGLSDQRVEFIPVEWRSSLKLDEGINLSGLPCTIIKITITTLLLLFLTRFLNF